MQRTLLATSILIALLLAACGGGSGTSATSTSTPPAETTTTAGRVPVLQADLVGGCFMMGPNCARYVIYSDASVEVYRLGGDAPELVWTGEVDQAVVADLEEAVSGADLVAVRGQLGPGTCNACVDGIDTILTFYVDGAEVVFDSTQVELDTTEPVFATAAVVVQAAVATGEMPIVTR